MSEFENSKDTTKTSLKEIVRSITQTFHADGGVYVAMGQMYLKIFGKKYYYTPSSETGVDVKNGICILCQQNMKEGTILDFTHDLFALRAHDEKSIPYYIIECSKTKKVYTLAANSK